jgi:zeaxanthin glucosyltransferase
MATIAILADIELSHIFPTFCLAKKLLARGHRVCYVGLPEAEDAIRAQGFEFRRLMDDPLLSELINQLGDWVHDNRESRLLEEQVDLIEKRYLELWLRGETADGLMRELKPDVVLVSWHYYFTALLVRYRYDTPVILLNASAMDIPRAQACQTVTRTLIEVPGASALVDLLLSANVAIKSFADVAALILQMPELMLSPKAFELPDAIKDPLVFHAGHEVDLERTESPYDWSPLRSDQPLIYCSFGSRPDLAGDVSRRLIRTVIDAAALRTDWQFVVSLGSKLDAEEFEPAPPHVVLSHWAPQLQMLTRASVMITHAGMNTVKECILHGVPMLALPIRDDQFSSANRIVHHGLGVRGDITRIAPEELSSMLNRLITDSSFKGRVERMREEFQRAEALNFGVTLIEKAIAGCLHTAGSG